MPENIIDMVRSRIEAIRGQAGGTSRQVPRIIEDIRGRIMAIRGEQGGIVERIGERFPAMKRVRGQLEPWERPALFERTPTRRETTVRKEIKRQIAGVEVTEMAKKPALF